jgi:hypothetical protein
MLFQELALNLSRLVSIPLDKYRTSYLSGGPPSQLHNCTTAVGLYKKPQQNSFFARLGRFFPFFTSKLITCANTWITNAAGKRAKI